MQLCRDGAVYTTIIQLMEVTLPFIACSLQYEDKLPLISTVSGTFTCFRGPIFLIFVQKILLFIGLNDVFSRSEVSLFLNVRSLQHNFLSNKLCTIIIPLLLSLHLI